MKLLLGGLIYMLNCFHIEDSYLDYFYILSIKTNSISCNNNNNTNNNKQHYMKKFDIL